MDVKSKVRRFAVRLSENSVSDARLRQFSNRNGWKTLISVGTCTATLSHRLADQYLAMELYEVRESWNALFDKCVAGEGVGGILIPPPWCMFPRSQNDLTAMAVEKICAKTSDI